MSFKRILIAVDGGSAAIKAGQAGIDLARSLGAKLATIYVVDPAVEYSGDLSLSPDEVKEVAQEKDAEVLAKLKASLPLPDDAEHFVRVGQAAVVIDKMAVDWGADVIVIGSHGRTGISRIILGSVSDDLVHRSSCPVIVVRESE
jgi:nucleotide-binding universal stress UspA family protein